jgi:hypothetical protein
MAGVEELTGADLEAHRIGKALLSKPEIRRQVQRLYKTANPTAVIPELEAEDALIAERDANDKRFRTLEEDNLKLRVKQRETERKEQCAKEGVEYDDVCKLVLEEHCSFETAIKLLKLQQQTAEPTAGEVNGGSAPGTPAELLPGDEFRKAGGNVTALRRVSAKVAGDLINQMRGRTARR